MTCTFTTIGYGSTFAVNLPEKIIMLVLIVISLILFSLIMGNIERYRPLMTMHIQEEKLKFESDEFLMEQISDYCSKVWKPKNEEIVIFEMMMTFNFEQQL